MSNGQGGRGFTLIELLVAIVIFLIIIGSIYGTLHAGQQSMARAEEQEDVQQVGRALLAQMSTELACVYHAAGDTTALVGEDTDGAGDGMQEDRVTLLTTAHAVRDDRVAGDLCRVSYSMADPDQNEEKGLYIEESLTPGLELSDAEPERRLLSSLVVGFNCKYLPVEGDWETEWVDQTTLPVAVRVELVLQSKRPGAKPVVMATTTNLAMATYPEEGTSDATP